MKQRVSLKEKIQQISILINLDQAERFQEDIDQMKIRSILRCNFKLNSKTIIDYFTSVQIHKKETILELSYTEQPSDVSTVDYFV